ncbi:MAG: hypothetical protein WA809_04155, partial [Candidatus Dormiibacterota bacterium]
RQDPALLAYSDSGDRLRAEQQEISTDTADKVTVLSIVDHISSVQVGSKVDPNNAAAQMAAIVQGRESREQRSGSAPTTRNSQSFHVLLWILWSPGQMRYLLCDTAEA